MTDHGLRVTEASLEGLLLCRHHRHFFFFLTLVTGPRRSFGLKLSDTRVYEPQKRARLGTTTHFCEVVVLKLRALPRPPRRGGGVGGSPSQPPSPPPPPWPLLPAERDNRLRARRARERQQVTSPSISRVRDGAPDYSRVVFRICEHNLATECMGRVRMSIM